MVKTHALRAGKVVSFAGAMVLTYFLSWFVVYAIVMNFDFGFVFEYLTLGWTGGGELPTFIQFGALLVTAIVALAAGLLAYFRARRRQPQGGTRSAAP